MSLIKGGVFLSLSFISFFVSSAEAIKTQIDYTEQAGTIKDSSVAKEWNLTMADFEKYKLIMSGSRGVFSPGIAPPLALALEADNNEDRKKYLTIYAKLEHERTKKDLETSRMYTKIFNDLYVEPVIDNSFLFSEDEEYIRSDDRFVIFIDSSCVDCKSKLLMSIVKTDNFPNNPTDIYVKGIDNERELGLWAKSNSIDVGKVDRGKITLNLLHLKSLPATASGDFSMYILRNDALHNFTN